MYTYDKYILTLNMLIISGELNTKITSFMNLLKVKGTGIS